MVFGVGCGMVRRFGNNEQFVTDLDEQSPGRASRPHQAFINTKAAIWMVMQGA